MIVLQLVVPPKFQYECRKRNSFGSTFLALSANQDFVSERKVMSDSTHRISTKKRMSQTMINLVRPAVKAIAEGGLAIDVFNSVF